jgi:hypothetical protein
MLKPPHEKINVTGEALQASLQDASSCYIFSEETVRSLQALGEVLRRIHNRLEAEKAAAIGAESPNNGSIKK